MHFKISKEALVTAAIFAMIYWFILSYVPLQYLLSPSPVTGGDMVGHSYGAYYMKDYLIPHLKLSGWNQDWFLGYPMFQFYFPLAFFIAGILGYVIPVEISFKLATILGTLLLPPAAFAFFRLLDFRFPVPQIAALLSLYMLFIERVSQQLIYSMWGGNIPSTLAGEFGYSLAFALSLVYLGLVYRSITHNKSYLPPAFVLFLVALGHFIVAIFAVAATVFFLFSKPNAKRVLATVALGLGLAAFWIVPMLAKVQYTVEHVWFPPVGEELYKMLLPEPLWLFYAASAILAIRSIIKRDVKMLLLPFVAIMAFALFIFTPIFNNLGIPGLSQLQLVKFLPFMYLSVILYPASALSLLKTGKNAACVGTLAVAVIAMVLLSQNVTYIGGWAKWNYEGMEPKTLGRDYMDAMAFLSQRSVGRVAFEYDPKPYDSGLGSPRVTETIPIFSGRPITEGTHFQSAVNGPYIYDAHCEYSNECSCVFGPLTNGCPTFDMGMGMKHLALFNVKDFFVSSAKVKDVLSKRNDAEKVYSNNAFDVWELKNNDGHYVTVPDYEPVLAVTKNWRQLSYKWFFNSTAIDVPMVWASDDVDAGKFKNVLHEPRSLADLPRQKMENNCTISETINEEEIKFTTNCIGKPHLVKISYFPNWHVEGAAKVYMVSPAFMLVYPEQDTVRLYYANTPSDWAGIAVTIVGACIVSAPLARKACAFHKTLRSI
ncbi:MAG TPA: hypothetical protein VI979_04770 [archaeon]|nr:hypothetical protein [archaeon]